MKKVKRNLNKIAKSLTMLAVTLFVICGAFIIQGEQTEVYATTLSDNDIDTTPVSTSEFIMVGGDWVTPTAVHGRTVNVVLPVVNMSVTNLTNVIVTPVIASDTKEWPFEIQTSGYTQTIPDLPGKGNGQNDMDRRRELTWTFQTREDVLNGYYKIPFNVIYYSGTSYETVTITTWVKAIGAPGSGQLSNGGSALSTPRVIITGFDTVPSKVYAGDTFTLTLHLKNTSKRTAVSNMQVDLSAPSAGTDTASTYEAFLPTSGSNTLYVERIGADATADVSIEMTAKADLSQKPYAIAVNMVYEDSDYAAFTAKADVSIPVNQDARFDISSMEIMPTDIPVGGQSNVMFSIYNTGKTTLYNVQVKFEGDSISGGSCFIGKIDPGGTGNVDAMVEGVAATADDGMVKAVVTYEDESGNAFTHEEMFTLYVYEESFDEEMMYDDIYMEEEGGKSHTGLIVGIVIILIIAAIVTTVIILKKRKRKKEQQELEEELLDDDIVSEDATDDAANIMDKNNLNQMQETASEKQEVETKTDSESEE
ncbi:MAG: hypothetical protein IIX48_08520 [Lachnospiraceae bacterium]|nr:hypothetical protein [Lachnospiraceae bacterium]